MTDILIKELYIFVTNREGLGYKKLVCRYHTNVRKSGFDTKILYQIQRKEIENNLVIEERKEEHEKVFI